MPSELQWDAPGPGDWWLVKEHFPYAVCRMFSSLFPPVTIGWKVGGERYGLPTGEARWGAVNGWIYYGPEIPLTAEELHARELTAARTFSSTPWRDEIQRWQEERPRVVEANRALQREDPHAMDDAGLAKHFRATVDNYLTSAPLHFEHNGFDVVAAQLFAAARDWGVDAPDIVELLTGASPATAAVDVHVRRIADAVTRADAQPRASVDELREVSGDAAEAVDAYLDEYGWRPIAGHDLLEPTLGERPELVVGAVNAAMRRPAKAPEADRVASVRDRVPTAERDRFDALLADARASYSLRDDDVGVCWNWPLGLVRRAACEIGDRVAERGRCALAQHIFEADAGEALELLGGRGPSAGELAQRWDTRVRASVEEPPVHLNGGGDPPAPLPLPPTVARLAAQRDAVWGVAPERIDAPLHGVGIGSDRVVGIARVVRQPEDMIRIVDGDVLVAVTTTTAFNAVFPLLAGVATQEGGLFSHTAILARELGLPAVVGVRELLDLVHDGDLIEVDPVAGTVRIVEPRH